MFPPATESSLVVECVRDGETYTLELPPPHGGRDVFFLNGEPVPNSGGASRLVAAEGLPRLELFRSDRVLVGYRATDPAMPGMEVADWEVENRRLLAGSVDGTGESWSSLDAELAWVRHQRAYHQETRAVLVKVCDVLLAIAEKTPEMPFVTPVRMIGGSYMKAVAAYDRPGFIEDLLVRRLDERGYSRGSGIGMNRRDEYRIYQHSGELSLHLPGGFHRKERVHVVTDAYTKVVGIRDRDTVMVDTWLDDYFSTVAMPVNAMEVAEGLREIAALVARLDVKAASRNDRIQVGRAVQGLLAKVSGKEV